MTRPTLQRSEPLDWFSRLVPVVPSGIRAPVIARPSVRT